jgi:hypothetical protein
MSNATLTITATVTNGGQTRASELQMLHEAVNIAMQKIRVAGGSQTSISANSGFNAASASATYSPVASS